MPEPIAQYQSTISDSLKHHAHNVNVVSRDKLKNYIGRNGIVSIKEMSDRIVLVEEVRSVRKRVALNSMRKYPRTVHATSILKSLYPTSETLSGNGVSVVRNPQPRNIEGNLKRSNNDDIRYSRGKTQVNIKPFSAYILRATIAHGKVNEWHKSYCNSC